MFGQLATLTANALDIEAAATGVARNVWTVAEGEAGKGRCKAVVNVNIPEPYIHNSKQKEICELVRCKLEAMREFKKIDAAISNGANHYEVTVEWDVAPRQATETPHFQEGSDRHVVCRDNGDWQHAYLLKKEHVVIVCTKTGFKILRGKIGMLRLWCMSDTPNEGVGVFDGPTGQEHMVREELHDATQIFYRGPCGQEHFVRIDYSSGVTQYYEGARGEERRVRAEFPGSGKQYYEGPCGQERMVRKEFSNGIKIFYEGPRGQERMVRSAGQAYEGAGGEKRKHGA